MDFETLATKIPAKIKREGVDLYLKLTSNLDGTMRHVSYFSVLDVKDTHTVLKESATTWTEAMQQMYNTLQEEQLI